MRLLILTTKPISEQGNVLSFTAVPPWSLDCLRGAKAWGMSSTETQKGQMWGPSTSLQVSLLLSLKTGKQIPAICWSTRKNEANILQNTGFIHLQSPLAWETGSVVSAYPVVAPSLWPGFVYPVQILLKSKSWPTHLVKECPTYGLSLTHGLVKVHIVALQGLFSWLSLQSKAESSLVGHSGEQHS